MKFKFLLLTLAVFLTGCAGLSVKQDYDTSADFAKLNTYAWQAHAAREPAGIAADTSLVNERVTNAADAALAKKGYRKLPGSADFLADYHYAVTKEIEADSGATVGFGTSYGSGFGMFGMGLGRNDRTVEIETLSLDIVSPATGKLLWRGFVEHELVRRADPVKATEDIKRAVEAILSKFPPKKGRE